MSEKLTFLTFPTNVTDKPEAVGGFVVVFLSANEEKIFKYVLNLQR